MSAAPPVSELRRCHWRMAQHRTTAGLEGTASAGALNASRKSSARTAPLTVRRRMQSSFTWGARAPRVGHRRTEMAGDPPFDRLSIRTLLPATPQGKAVASRLRRRGADLLGQVLRDPLRLAGW